MKRYIKSTDDTTLTIELLMEQIKDIYYRRFPNSLCETNFGRLLGSPFLFIRCYLAKDSSEVANGILDNDMFSIRGSIDFTGAPKDLSEEEPVPQNCELGFLCRSIKTEPDLDYLYCSYATINFRKVVGNVDKVLAGWEKFVDKLYAETVSLYQEGKLHKSTSEYYNIEDKI